MARKKSDRSPVDPDDNELDWLRESESDARDYIDKLVEENADLRAENTRLADEVTVLRQRIKSDEPSKNLIAPIPSPSTTSSPSTSKASPKIIPALPSTGDRIALFRGLFRGREDIYAKRWESPKSGKSGYSPVCAMEWKRPHCTKPQKKCTDCVYSPLTDGIVASHFDGNTTIGAYAILQDDTWKASACTEFGIRKS